MTDTDTRCPECGWRDGLEVNKTVNDNDVVEDGLYCPDCGTEFGEDTVLQWDDLEFPVWIEWESYNDNWNFMREFYRRTGLYKGDYDGAVTDEMKYTIFCVWFRVDEDGSVVGPFDAKEGQRL